MTLVQQGDSRVGFMPGLGAQRSNCTCALTTLSQRLPQGSVLSDSAVYGSIAREPYEPTDCRLKTLHAERVNSYSKYA